MLSCINLGWVRLLSFGLVYVVLGWISLNYVMLVSGRDILTILTILTISRCSAFGSQLLSSLVAETKKPPSPRLEPRTIFQGFCLCSCNLSAESCIFGLGLIFYRAYFSS
jgi:hypothetical protein